MMGLESIFIIIFSIFENVTLGSPIIFGFGVFVVFGFMSLKANLPLAGWLAWMMPTVILLAYGNKLPAWFKPGFIIFYAVLFALGWVYIVSRR